MTEPEQAAPVDVDQAGDAIARLRATLAAATEPRAGGISVSKRDLGIVLADLDDYRSTGPADDCRACGSTPNDW